MEITIDLIKELREATYAPVGDCKKALELANGDISAAKDELKKLGKSTERTVIPEAGAISIRASDRCICIAVGRSETDFVSRNEQFIKFTDEAANEYYDRAGFNVQEIIDECNENIKLLNICSNLNINFFIYTYIYIYIYIKYEF